jgi:histone H3/H4
MEMIVVKSKVKEVAKNCNVAGDFADKLNEVAVAEVKKAVDRAVANNRKTVSKKDICLCDGKGNDVMLVVKSKVKEVVGANNNVSGDFAEGLNAVLTWFVTEAEKRAEANGRKTIQARDL